MKKYTALSCAVACSLLLCTCAQKTESEPETESSQENMTSVSEIMGESAQAEETQETEAILQREAVLYQKYNRTLREIDKKRKECTIFGEDGWENAKDCYRAVLAETMFGMLKNSIRDNKHMVNEMRGILAAEAVGRGFGVRIAISEADEIWEYGYYEERYYDMLYITCRKTGAKEGDVPEYQMSEEVLSHWEASGSESYEAEWADWLDKHGQATDGEVTEYCVVDNHVYRIDREKEQFHDVTGQAESYMVQWLQCEKEKAYYGMKLTDEAVEKVKELIPDGYRLKWETGMSIAVCDLNHDGKDDYVASIYDPKCMTEEEFYYAAEDLWLFLSDGSGGYIKKQLVENDLKCIQLQFVGDGVLMCENIAGMGWYGQPLRRDYFLYDDATENFYLDKVRQCELEYGILIENRTTFKSLRIDDYWGRGDVEDISRGENPILPYDVYPEDGRKVEFDNMVIYRNADKEMEKTVNDKVFEMELAAAESLLRECDENIRIKFCLEYLNPHIYGGYIWGTVWKKEGAVDYYASVIIDLESGEFLDITDLISKEEFIKICRKGMKDRYRIELSKEEMERGISLIRDKYEDAFRVTSSGELILTPEESWICLEITSWGVQVTGKDDAGGIKFYLDKEYFIDTPLWKYMEPDF
ncbi:MAG: hypothetical protein NC231_10400 [Bacillus sp. (in: Bacteria)]|nr:hypothetical protein [Bacillus sp. (in: firmicutes)]MCM1427511.1 hypothetical protein [Eubacterium sp.]